MKPEERVAWVYAATDPDELARRYDHWARTYESDLRDHFGRPPREPIADAVARYVPRAARVLDAGAGTGVAGVWLAEMGHTDVVGFDISAAMLDIARAKGVYRALHQMALGQPLAFADDAFDAVLAVGVFTHGHAPLSAFDELIRVTRPGGYILFTLLLEFGDEPATRAALQAFEDAGAWQLVERGAPYGNDAAAGPDIRLRTHVYRVCAAPGAEAC